MRYIIGLGSNKGDKGEFLRRATEFLSTLGKVILKSSIYETTPVGMEPGSDNFYNSVNVLDTEITPEIMLQYIKKFENKMGRSTVNSHMNPREIDIDILFADRIVLRTHLLTIPHPELHNRRFVLEPLAEILPEFIHPVSGKTVTELLDKLKTGEEIKIVKTDTSESS